MKHLFKSQFVGNICERSHKKYLRYDNLQPKATDKDVVILSEYIPIPSDLDASTFSLEHSQQTGFNLQPIKNDYYHSTLEESTDSLETLLDKTNDVINKQNNE